MARTLRSKIAGFTLIEILVSLGVLGILMSSLMVAFRSTFDTVTETQLRAEMNQNVRSVMDQLNRELSQALVNNNRPVGEQIYFQIKQLSPDQSVIRFGCTTERGMKELAYAMREVKIDDQPQWPDYELVRMQKDKGMWNFNEPKNWPEFDVNDTEEVEPFAFDIISFRVLYWSTKNGRFVAGNWDSFQRNGMPAKVRIILKAIPRSDAKKGLATKNMSDLKGLEEHKIDIILPQAM